MSVADELFALFREAGDSAYYGEVVSTTEHCLQAAHFAALEGAPPGLVAAALLHDIGKIGVPDRILLKPGSLSEDEWVEMRKHPEIGSWIVSGVESLKRAADIVISHHERFDGKGYPAAVSGQRIPLGARVFAVADCLDAILSDRPYRGGQTSEHAREEIARHAGSQFDPEVTRCFLKIPNSVWEDIREKTLATQQAIHPVSL